MAEQLAALLVEHETTLVGGRVILEATDRLGVAHAGELVNRAVVLSRVRLKRVTSRPASLG